MIPHFSFPKVKVRIHALCNFSMVGGFARMGDWRALCSVGASYDGGNHSFMLES